MLPTTMPGASRLTISHRTAPRFWCALTLDSEVKMIVAMEVAMAIFTDRSGDTPWFVKMMVMNGTISMPPPIPNKPARKPVPRPSRASSAISRGSNIMGALRSGAVRPVERASRPQEKNKVSANATGPSS